MPQSHVVRKLIHIDMDAFFASVEQRDNPEYQGKPLVVGGTPDRRGAVAAASYEARRYGIHSAMPSRLAYQKCRHLIFVPPRFEVYKAVSEQIREVFYRYTELVEPVSLDEAYLDVTINKRDMPSATQIAQEIKSAIRIETGLSASAGVSCNKFLAKMASGVNKPDGLYVILPEQVAAFVEALAIEKFHGIGKVTAARMQQLSIQTGADLRSHPLEELVRHFGKAGHYFYGIARGIDEREVNPNRMRKSLGVETSFAVDLEDRKVMLRELEKLVLALKERLEAQSASGSTLTLKLKYADYRQLTRSKTVGYAIVEVETIRLMARELFALVEVEQQKVRLLGLSVSNLRSEPSLDEAVQLRLEV
ncbi:MAG: DNA polymerase IV [Gemmatimonadaceae bacterium]|nr:DNA polymerase IV [Gloeobacterales cyanobacterium ES-bin-141]